MKKYKLEDCPWCESGDHVEIGGSFEVWGPDRVYSNYVFCKGCHARGADSKDHEKAAEKWNDVMGKVRRFESEIEEQK